MRLAAGLKLERRPDTTVWVELAAVGLALAAALLVSAGLIATSGADVLAALQALFRGAFGNRNAILETLVQATPLIFTGLAMVIAFRARVWNIGAEGQFFAGAIASAWISLNFSYLPRPVLWPLLLLGAALAGALWGMVPAILKVRFGANEIIVTVMSNYLVMLFLSYLLSGQWNEPGDYYLQTPKFAESTYLPTFFGSRIHLGLFVALLCAVILYVVLWRTPLGYEVRAVGENPVAARYKGINLSRTIILVMLISGAIAGLAGAGELQGLHHRLRLDISNSYGFTGILIALLGRLHPLGVILAAVFFGALVNGSTGMQIFTGVPVALVFSVQSIVLVCLLVAETLTHYRLRRTVDAG